MKQRPDENPKSAYGMKKAPVGLVPPILELTVARVMEHGADKYGPYNWRDAGVSGMVYINAAKRHLAAYLDGENTDPDSGEPHLAHVAACMGIMLDAESVGKLRDDRPTPGVAGSHIQADTRTEEAHSITMTMQAHD